MNENNSKIPDEGRLIDYLLNESSSEERVEIEILCGENPDWQEAKAELERTLGLIEDACKQPATEVKGEMELDPRRRQELESLRSGKSVESGEPAEQEAETEERMLIFKPAVWVPLAAAACAALLVWAPGLMDQETPEQQLAAAVSAPEESGKKEKSPATETGERTLQPGKLGLAKNDNANADPSRYLAFKAASQKENQDKSGGTGLELEEELVVALEERALDGANDVLNGRSARDITVLNDKVAQDDGTTTISLADAFAKPSSGIGDFSVASDSAALPPQPATPFKSIAAAVSPAPAVPSSIEDEDNPTVARITSGISGQGPGQGAGLDNRKGLRELAEDEKGLARRRADSDDRLTINKTQSLAADFTIGTVPRSELSANKDSTKTRKNSTLYSLVDQKRSKPASWTALVRKPRVCFLFNKDGQALGEVVVTKSEGKISGIRRMGEIRQGKRFLLTPGQFELRFTDQGGSVVILSGKLKREKNLSDDEAPEAKSKSSRDGDYEFEAKEAWWLDQNEVRQALPVNELAR